VAGGATRVPQRTIDPTCRHVVSRVDVPGVVNGWSRDYWPGAVQICSMHRFEQHSASPEQC
jgi:hypothetical protein